MSEFTRGYEDPVFTPAEVAAINSHLDITGHFGPHHTAEDATMVAAEIQVANVVIPEFAGWNELALRAANIYAATREQKAAMSEDERELGRQFALHIHTKGPYWQALYKSVRNTGKDIAFIDVRDDHPLVERQEEAGDTFFSSHVMKNAITGNFDADLAAFGTAFAEVEPLTRDRELTIRNNLKDLLLEQAAKAGESNPTKVLYILGGAHTVTGAWLRAAGVSAPNTPSSVTQVNLYNDIVSKSMDGVALSDEDLARALLNGVFVQAAEQYGDDLLNDPSYPRSAKNEIAAYFAHGFSLEDMKYVWEAPDGEEMAQRFEAIKAKNGLTAFDKAA